MGGDIYVEQNFSVYTVDFWIAKNKFLKSTYINFFFLKANIYIQYVFFMDTLPNESQIFFFETDTSKGSSNIQRSQWTKNEK